ncbi:MAG TPA: TonB-dependent receptor [Gemmatimonadota bacterium]|nr:TonB-dependent receptor [Gemmatimonadota bacterium]
MVRSVFGAAASILALAAPVSLLAQETPVLQGKVFDAATGAPLIGAQVTVAGTDQGAVTDVDGRYRLELTPGTYDLSVVYLGYTDKRVTGAQVRPVRGNWLDIALQSEAIQADAIQVTISAAEERGSVIGALAHQRRTTNVVNGISAEEIGRAPASNAADAIQRVSGTSIVDGRYVYVRGLGERYSTAQLDGVSLPTPEPEKRVLPLDIFPASMVESLFTVKSYTADLPGDFAGGLVDIQTKDIPDYGFFTVSSGVGLNSNLGGIDRVSYRGGDLDWLGFDDGTRSLPAAFPDRIAASATVAERAALHDALDGDFRITSHEVGVEDVNTTLSVSFGDRTDWFGRTGGYLVGLSYGKSANAREQDEFYPSLEAGRIQYDYDTRLGTREFSLGAIAGYALDPTPTSRLSFKAFFTQNTEDETRFVTGPFDQSTTGFGRITRFQFVERSLVNTMATFEHKLGLLGDGRLTWDASYALALRDEPDTRQSSYVAQAAGGTFVFNEAGNNSRFFSELTDHMGQAGVKMSTRFDFWGRQVTLDTGLRGALRTRSFSARRFAYEGASPEGRVLPPAELMTGASIAAGRIKFSEITEPNDAYDANEATGAAYASLGFGLTDALRATVGLRLETNTTEIESFDPRTGARVSPLSAELSSVEPLPTVTLQWEYAERQSLRAAVARTVVRPQFRELAPFRYDSYLESTLGNPFLENGEIYNADLRWSWFPTLGETVSFGGFYKLFNDPIEIVRLPTAGNNVGTPEPYNGPSAATYGVELDVRHDLGRWLPVPGLVLSGNATLATSNVEQDEPIEVFFGSSAAAGPDVLLPEIFTNPERPMYYQSPFLVNAALHYDSDSGATGASLLYSGVGERLTQVGVNDYDDIYEDARHSLDASMEQRVPGGVTLRAAVSNLTDAPIRYRLGDDSTLHYEPGRTFSLKATYSF